MDSQQLTSTASDHVCLARQCFRRPLSVPRYLQEDQTLVCMAKNEATYKGSRLVLSSLSASQAGSSRILRAASSVASRQALLGLGLHGFHWRIAPLSTVQLHIGGSGYFLQVCSLLSGQAPLYGTDNCLALHRPGVHTT